MLKNYEIVDLSVPLGENYPCVWPGHIPFQRVNHSWFEPINYEHGIVKNENADYYYNEWFMVDEHTGTHFDAPAHYFAHPNSSLPNAHPVGKIYGHLVDLSKMMGDAVVIDATDLRDQGENGISPKFTKEDILLWEEKNGKINAGEIVLFYTGWDEFYLQGQEGYHYFLSICDKTSGGWPTLDVDAIVYLYESGVSCIATDAGSIGANDGNAPMHIAGLSREMVYVEALCNIGRLPVRGAKFVFLPIKIEYSSGGPGRAVGLIPK